MDEVSLNGYKPNYEQECSKCGESPCVDVIRNGRMVHTSDLCGPHFFHCQDAVDPEIWNELFNDEED